MKKLLILLILLHFTNIIQSQTVTTFAGSGMPGVANGTGSAAQFNRPAGVAIDGSGNVYVADYFNHLIRKITSAGVVSTLAGSGIAGFANGIGITAQFNRPIGVAVDGFGNIYVADSNNNLIRKITSAGVVTTLAGSGMVGSINGIGTLAQFNTPAGIATDESGNVYVADINNHLIRKITSTGIVTTLAGSTQGFVDGPNTAAKFNLPSGLATDGSGNIYVVDSNNQSIRKITSAGVVITFAGSYNFGSVNGIGIAAKFNYPNGVATDVLGNVYVADTGNHRIRKITSAGAVTTLAGSTSGYIDGIGIAAKFYSPVGVATDLSGNLYIADYDNHRIRKISASLGVHQNDTESFNFEIYPNPSTNFLTIYLDQLAENTQLNVVDVLGKNIFTQVINEATTTISTNGFSKGIYFLVVTIDSQKTTKKFVVE